MLMLFGGVYRLSTATFIFQVSKEQHQRVMNSMKHSGNNIQSRSLNHVLGNLDTFQVQPYEVFEEEERLKLREHWLVILRSKNYIKLFNFLFFKISFSVYVGCNWQTNTSQQVLPTGDKCS